MRILVGWDQSAEAETIELCLNVDGTMATVQTELAPFEKAAETEEWDVVLLALNFPSQDDSFELFQRVQAVQPTVPIVGACQLDKMIQLPRFIKNGIQSYVMRDDNGEFIFLLTSMLESAYEGAQAMRSRELAARLQEEVSSVRRLQESVIPDDLHAPPGYQITARYEQSQIRIMGGQPVVLAGGDYYDVFHIDENRLVFMVGDASGHGMKACMSIMAMHTLIRMIREQRYPDTAEFVAEVNRRLCGNQIIADEGGFITVLYCILDTSTHTLQWTSAGHPMPLLQNMDTNEVTTIGGDAGGIPLGITDEFPYDVCTGEIPPRSRLLFYTDGLAEAFPDGVEPHQEFGEAGIVRAMQDSAALPLNDAMLHLFAASSEFTAGSGRHDDTSVVFLERD